MHRQCGENCLLLLSSPSKEFGKAAYSCMAVAAPPYGPSRCPDRVVGSPCLRCPLWQGSSLPANCPFSLIPTLWGVGGAQPQNVPKQKTIPPNTGPSLALLVGASLPFSSGLVPKQSLTGGPHHPWGLTARPQWLLWLAGWIPCNFASRAVFRHSTVLASQPWPMN